jgi:hypothetical protein
MTEDIQKLITSVIEASARACNITVEEVLMEGRPRARVRARFIGWMIISDMTRDMKYPSGINMVTLEMIGKAYGGFNHATVIYGKDVARSKVWGDGVNPPLALWAKAYEDMLAELSPTIVESAPENPRLFFPYTPLGHANARRFLRDIRKNNLRHEGMEDIITFANQQINQYRS